MLVLTRKIDESIIIGDNIDIKVLALSGSQVKIGISAPRSLRILRKEVFDEIQSGQRKDSALPAEGGPRPGEHHPEEGRRGVEPQEPHGGPAS